MYSWSLITYTGKVFEYLGARWPILVVGPKGGVVDALMQKTRAGIVLETREEIISALRLWMKNLLRVVKK